jgi:flagellar biogenesis protein FliO
MNSDGVRANGLTAPTWALPAGWWLRVRAGWERILRLKRPSHRRLRLTETLPLGERRFVAVLEFERERFLLGGTASSLVLLTRLKGNNEENNPEQSSWERFSWGGNANAAEAGRS